MSKPGQPLPYEQTETSEPSQSPPYQPTQASEPNQSLPYEPTLVSEPAQASQPLQYQPRQGSQPQAGLGWASTVTTAGDGSPAPPVSQAEAASRGGGSAGSGGYPQQDLQQGISRYGPGVPAPDASRAVPTAEEVWRTGLPDEPRRRSQLPRLPRWASTTLTVVLLVASGVVIFLRLHHGPFGVTGVAITSQVKSGCTEDVTGRVSTTGAAGSVSYQWVFQPQVAAPRPLNQSVAAGQSAVYVTAAVEGQGHGSLTQTVTLQVLGPGHGSSASAHVVLSC